MEMITEVIYNKSFLTIFYKPELKQVHLKWKGYATSAQFREGLTAALNSVQEYRVENWLGDLKLMEVILPQDEDWATFQLFPLLGSTTLKKMAIVTSLDFLNNSSVKRIVNVALPHVQFETKYFVVVVEASVWLEKTA